VDAFCPDDRIKGLERLCGKQNRRPESPNMACQMDEYMELGFVEPLIGPERSSKEESFNFGV
jgi:hypothetical protein